MGKIKIYMGEGQINPAIAAHLRSNKMATAWKAMSRISAGIEQKEVLKETTSFSSVANAGQQTAVNPTKLRTA